MDRIPFASVLRIEYIGKKLFLMSSIDVRAFVDIL